MLCGTCERRWRTPNRAGAGSAPARLPRCHQREPEHQASRRIPRAAGAEPRPRKDEAVKAIACCLLIALSGCAGSTPSSKESLAGQPRPDAAASFSHPQKGDTLWVKSWSAGCFGRYDHVEITVLGRKLDVAGVVYVRGATRLVTDTKSVSLSVLDRARLDSLFAMCRTTPTRAYSTGAMDIEFSMSRHGRRHPPVMFRNPRLRWGDFDILYAIAEREAL
jgi:hypothetical protein